MPTPPTACRRLVLDIEYIIMGVIALGLFAYLTYALLRPEKF